MKNLVMFSFSLVFTINALHSVALTSPNILLPKVESTNKVIVPFELYKGLIFIDAEIDGQQGQFLLDTGAPDIILNNRNFKGLASNLSITDVNNQSQKVEMYSIQKLFTGNISWSKFRAMTMDLVHLEQVNRRKLLGILGYTAFKKYEMMLDYEQQELTLFKLDKKGHRLEKSQDKPQHTSIFKQIKHLAVLEVKAGNQMLKLGLDTGAQSNLLHKKWEKTLYHHFMTYQKVNLNGANQQQKESVRGQFDEMKIGDLSFEKMKTVVADLSHFIKSNNIKIDGLLGYEFLKKWKISINFKKKEIYWWEKVPDKQQVQKEEKETTKTMDDIST